MQTSIACGRCSAELVKTADHMMTVRLHGDIDASTAAALLHDLVPRISEPHCAHIAVDFSGILRQSDWSTLVGLELKKTAVRIGAVFTATGVSAYYSRFFQEIPITDPHPLPPQHADTALTRFGAAILKLGSDLVLMVRFVGSMCLAVGSLVRTPKNLRIDDTFTAMQRIGVDALPIVGLISFLLGLIMAFMAAVQLRMFGANIYVASLVSLAMTRELGPIMTAIIVAGRSGSAFAAEIGTMKISDEIDALTTMGFEPVEFLVMPKLIAAAIVVPLLVLYADLLGIFGGLVVGVGMLDLTAASYIAQTLKTIEVFDVFWGVGKAGIFAVLITWIGCFRGFQVRGGAAAVGAATTSAVVSGIFLIILADSVFAVILRYWG
ncbi:MAG: ABC transporter permease [Desulfobacterota bacterium]|nr:ABC transporter permease [Thermodesulfobacteriota bacterium]